MGKKYAKNLLSSSVLIGSHDIPKGGILELNEGWEDDILFKNAQDQGFIKIVDGDREARVESDEVADEKPESREDKKSKKNMFSL